MLKIHALRDAARGVAERLMPVEDNVDTTVSQAAGLLAYLPQARLEADLPMSAGHDAMKSVLASLNAMFDARDHLLKAHEAFAKMRDDLRIPVTDTGSLKGCPTGALRVVDAA